MENDLSVKNVTKKFNEFIAVDSVSFDIARGDFFSILGPSGCGKTTLLRMIAGFESHTEGKIEIRGQDMENIVPNKRPVNMVFQHLALFPMMNVAENVAFGLKRRGMNRSEVEPRVKSMLERVGLPGFEEKQVNQLSGGQKQRVAIARSLILEPAVLLLDEPLGALDLKLREHMKVELKKLQEEIGTTFMYITHDQSEALVMSDYIAVMNKGRFEQIDTPNNLYNHPSTTFVAQFVGENNAWSGTLTRSDGKTAEIKTTDGNAFKVDANDTITEGSKIDLFLRPEALLIQPDPSLKDVNRFDTVVTSILFDGASSRLLVTPINTKKEIIVALPQNRQYDHIRPKDKIELGWSENAGIYFAKDNLL
ncbi:ABC transporter ATP-binding protein [bacterium]|nr:ABC transporter ATP-binding protein [bacterium]